VSSERESIIGGESGGKFEQRDAAIGQTRFPTSPSSESRESGLKIAQRASFVLLIDYTSDAQRFPISRNNRNVGTGDESGVDNRGTGRQSEFYLM